MLQIQPSWKPRGKYLTSNAKLPTRAERDYLFPDKHAKLTGFYPRAEQRFALHSHPHKDVVAEFSRRLNASLQRNCPSPSYQGWLDIGSFAPIFPDRTDREYNSNTWRYYVSQNLEHYANINQRRFPKLIASLYPISIPPPSRMRENTWLRFLSCGNLYIDLQGKKKTITLLEKEQEHYRKLKIKSENRMPPIDIHGNIIPPENIKGHLSRIPHLLPCCDIPNEKETKIKSTISSSKKLP